MGPGTGEYLTCPMGQGTGELKQTNDCQATYFFHAALLETVKTVTAGVFYVFDCPIRSYFY